MAGVDWNITDASFFIPGQPVVTFNVARAQKISSGVGMMSQEVTFERRLQVAERAGVDGGDVEDFGRKARTFAAEVVFFGADYLPRVAEFEKTLNLGLSGTLILPDLDEAVYAKYQRHTRKSSTGEGGTTVLSVTWIEDNTKEKLVNLDRINSLASSALFSGEIKDSVPTIAALVSDVGAKIEASRSALNNNAFLTALTKAENAVVSATSTINLVTGLPKVLRQDILGTVDRIRLELKALESAAKGISNLSDLLNLGLDLAGPVSTATLGSIDFTKVNDPATATVTGVAQVVLIAPIVSKPIQNLPDAAPALGLGVSAIVKSKEDLEKKSGGQTTDFSSAAIALINSVKDLQRIITSTTTTTILTSAPATLLEVCFRNGKLPSDIDRVYANNRQLTDILNIPALTVINL